MALHKDRQLRQLSEHPDRTAMILPWRRQAGERKQAAPVEEENPKLCFTLAGSKEHKLQILSSQSQILTRLQAGWRREFHSLPDTRLGVGFQRDACLQKQSDRGGTVPPPPGPQASTGGSHFTGE